MYCFLQVYSSGTSQQDYRQYGSNIERVNFAACIVPSDYAIQIDLASTLEIQFLSNPGQPEKREREWLMMANGSPTKGDPDIPAANSLGALSEDELCRPVL